MRENSKNHFKTYIIVGILLFFGVLFFYTLTKLSVFSEDTKASTVLNDQITFEQPKLSIFDETRYINAFPDTIHMHYPYFIVVVPEDTNKITTVYNLEEKRKVATYNDIVLDYYNGDFLYNQHGGNTFFKSKNLGLHCDQGFIKNENEILCITAKDNDPMDNKLISIDPQKLSIKDIYNSQNSITTVYYDKDTLYIGEYNYAKKKAYVTVDNKIMETDHLINIIYPIKDKIYVASFKSVQNNNIESYFQILTKNMKVKLINRGSIKFY